MPKHSFGPAERVATDGHPGQLAGAGCVGQRRTTDQINWRIMLRSVLLVDQPMTFHFVEIWWYGFTRIVFITHCL